MFVSSRVTCMARQGHLVVSEGRSLLGINIRLRSRGGFHTDIDPPLDALGAHVPLVPVLLVELVGSGRSRRVERLHRDVVVLVVQRSHDVVSRPGAGALVGRFVAVVPDARRSGDLGDQRCHGHLDVELDQIRHGMELCKHNLVREGHESYEHNLHFKDTLAGW